VLFLAAGPLAGIAGYEWRALYGLGVPVVMTTIAVAVREPWPIVHERMMIFYWWPAWMIAWPTVASWVLSGVPLGVVDWGGWLGAAALVAMFVTAGLTWALYGWARKRTDVVYTCLAVFVFASEALSVANVMLPQSSSTEPVVVLDSNQMFGLRAPYSTILVAPTSALGQASRHVVGWDTARSLAHGEPVCLTVYDGGLGWRWTSINACA
jgi:hypothetical protein